MSSERLSKDPPMQPPAAPMPDGAAPKPAPPTEQPGRAVEAFQAHELRGRRFELVEKPRFGFEISAPPAPNTIRDWAIKKNLPVWLAAAMAEGQPVNKEFTEPEIDALAERIAKLPLGRKGA